MDDGILLGLDIGTTKVCVIVGEIHDGRMQIIGLGIEPSAGMRAGMVVDVQAASKAILAAIEKAEQTSGYELSSGLVSMAGEHLRSMNNLGAVEIKSKSTITLNDVNRAMAAAKSSYLPDNRQIVHTLPRHYRVDNQRGIVNPVGMSGNLLEVEAHIITASSMALKNLSQCASTVGIETEDFVLNVLASAEAVLEPSEKEMGVVVADIGGGTTDIALYTGGSVWHTAVIPIGGHHITNDVAVGLRVPYDIAEEVKIRYGDCRPNEIDPENVFNVKPFSGGNIVVGRQDLAMVIDARVEEIFDMVLLSLKNSGYDGLLPAGIILTGGTSQLRGITTVAERVLGVPARTAAPRNLLGLVDNLQNPAYSTGVGLLTWAANNEALFHTPQKKRDKKKRKIAGWLRNLLPDS